MEHVPLLKVACVSAHTLKVSPKTRWIFVRLALENGVEGFGEATDFIEHDEVLRMISKFATKLPGRSDASELLARSAAEGGAMRVACSGIEQALMDATAKSSNLLLADLLGGPRRQRVPIYANINRGSTRSPDGMAQAAAAAVARGYRAIKIAPFDEVRPDCDPVAVDVGVERILAVREKIGSDIALRVDCHERLTPHMANRILRATDSASLDWIEDVLDPTKFDVTSRRAFRSAANDKGIRVAGGENLSTPAQARTLLADEHLDILLPDLRLTGVRDGLTILEFANAFGVGASLHSPVSPILDAVSLQVAAAASEFWTLERQVNESPLYDQICNVTPVEPDGCVCVPTSGGSGARLDIELLNAESELAGQ